MAEGEGLLTLFDQYVADRNPWALKPGASVLLNRNDLGASHGVYLEGFRTQEMAPPSTSSFNQTKLIPTHHTLFKRLLVIAAS